MYQSLYRKYRPQSFDEVVGQNVIIKTLKNSVKNNKLSHAYLFAGPRGTGKTSVAKILAKTINCENLENLNPCNKCVVCTQINQKQSIDIIEIDAASNNGVDEIREINNKVNLVPSIGKYKVYIIDEVHMLTTGAFNALLKTLEEPPSHIIFILATTEPHKIPATILSRCQRFDFKKLSTEEIINRIEIIVKEEKIKIDKEAIKEIAILSDGGMRDALSMLDQAVAYSDDKVTVEDIHEINGTITNIELSKFLESLVNKDIKEVFKKIDEFDTKGKDFIKLTEEIILFFRNVLIEQTIENNENEIFKTFSKLISSEELMIFIKKFNSIFPEMKNSNHPRVIFEVLVIQLLDNSNIEEQIEVKKEEKPTIKKEEVKEKPKELINNTLNDDLKNLKNIRINNTLCNLDKNKAMELKEKIKNISSSLILDEYAIYYSLILEGKITAYGNNIIIFVYETERLSNEFNQNLLSLESMLEKYLGEHYKVISTYQDEWNTIKKEYSKDKSKYQYIEEPDILKNEEKINNSIEDMFENIVEYS